MPRIRVRDVDVLFLKLLSANCAVAVVLSELLE